MPRHGLSMVATMPEPVTAINGTDANGISASAKTFDALSFTDLNPPKPEELVKVSGSCDWSKDDLLESPYWGLELSDSDLEEIKDALAVCKAEGSGLDLQDGWQPLGVTQENFPLKVRP